MWYKKTNDRIAQTTQSKRITLFELMDIQIFKTKLKEAIPKFEPSITL